MKNFELLVIIVAVHYAFHQSPQVEKESGAEGEEDIGDSGQFYKLNNDWLISHYLWSETFKLIWTIHF